MLIHRGNHKDWIDPAWIEWLLTHSGTLLPKDRLENGTLDSLIHDMGGEEFSWFTKYGYDPHSTFCSQFKWSDPPEKFPFKLEFSFIEGVVKRWVIFKYTPGQFVPMHVDDKRFPGERRFIMPLTPWEPGHIMINNNEYIKDYQVGDLLEFDDAEIEHGAANIGKNTRLLLSIISYDSEIWN
jgi:hypothetical protein